MIFTIRAKSVGRTPLAVATEDPVEALESLTAFRKAQLMAVVLDELGRPLQAKDLMKFIETEKNLRRR